MSTLIPDHNVHTPSKSSKVKKPRERGRKEKTQPSPGERLKIVVRRLPSNLPEDIFWQSVSNWVSTDSVSWKAYYPGKPKKRYAPMVKREGKLIYYIRMNKENIPSRAYIAFKTQEQVAIFGREYDGHKFIDKAGGVPTRAPKPVHYDLIIGTRK